MGNSGLYEVLEIIKYACKIQFQIIPKNRVNIPAS